MSPTAQPLNQPTPWLTHKNVLFFLIGLRLANALSIRTYFQADEYFQALEPAWEMAFGDASGAWITWEWKHQLRSSLHPLLFAIVYLLVDYMSVDSGFEPTRRAALLIAAPKAVQGAIAALGDFCTWRLAERIFGRGSNAALATLIMTVVNPWQWYVSTRTFSNSLEMVLTVAALYHWPWRLLGEKTEKKEPLFSRSGEISGLAVSLVLAAIAVLLRPTNVLIWFSIMTLAVTRFTLDGRSPLNLSAFFILTGQIILCGSVVLGISLCCDRLYFGFWTFPPYTFFHFNISQSLAVFYGQNDWHYYLSQGISLSSTTVMPFVLLGLWSPTAYATNPQQANILRTFVFVIVTTISVLSLVSHKEVRFIFPIVPLLHIVAAPHVAAFFTESPATSASEAEQHGSASFPPLKRKPLITLLLIVNAVVGSYLSYFHNGATITVTQVLRTEFEREYGSARLKGPLTLPPYIVDPTERKDDSPDPRPDPWVIFLMPCHSTPWRSHLVWPKLTARALTCDPPIDTTPGTKEREEYKEETARFYDDTELFLDTEVWEGGRILRNPAERPRFVVGFEGIEKTLGKYVADRTEALRIERFWSGWNGLFTDDDRKADQMVIWRFIDTSNKTGATS